MKKMLIQIGGITFGLLLAGSLASAEPGWGPKWKESRDKKPGFFENGWADEQDREVKGQLGRGSKYSKQKNPTPLNVWWNDSSPSFDTQY